MQQKSAEKNYKEIAIKNAKIIFIFSLVAGGLGYLLRLILARSLTPAEYGLFYATYTFVSAFILLRELGLGSTLSKFIAEYEAKKDKVMIKKLILSAFQIQMISGCIIMLIIFFSSDYLALHFFHNTAASILIKVFIIAFWLAIIQDIFASTAIGLQNTAYMSVVESMRTILVIGIALTLLFFTPLKNAIAPALAYLAAQLILPFIYYNLFNRMLPDFSKTPAKLDSQVTWKMLRFSSPLLLASAGSIIIASTDTLALTYFRSLNEVALYQIALPIVSVLWYFSLSIGTVMLPMSSELLSRGHHTKIKNAVETIFKYSFAIIIPFAMLLVAFPEIVIRLIFGNQYVAAAPALQILAFSSIFYTIWFINSFTLTGLGKPEINTKITLSVAIGNIILSILIVPVYGVIGAAITNAISYLLLMILTSIELRRHIHATIPWLEWGKCILAGAALIATTLLIKVTVYTNVWVKTLLSVVLGFSVYFLILYLTKVINIKEIKDALVKNK